MVAFPDPYRTVVFALGLAFGAGVPESALAAEGDNPYATPVQGPQWVDYRWEARARNGGMAAPMHPRAALPTEEPGLPGGWVQLGDRVVPEGLLDGTLTGVARPPLQNCDEDAFTCVPGNAYPRGHTVFLNFDGTVLRLGAKDNSARDESVMVRGGDPYPGFNGGGSQAAAVLQAVQQDFAPWGVRVVDERPSELVPYTMIMVGGDWTDTRLDEPAGGVASSADCEALGQRHVAFVFPGYNSTNWIAYTASQEAGHGFGLDHTFDCNSPMSYCNGGSGDARFSTTCVDLCGDDGCSGRPGCNLTHRKYCPEGQQNDGAELEFLFGDGAVDISDPFVEIELPEDGAEYPPGSTIPLRAVIEDDFGGFGWRIVVEHDGEVVFDAVDYHREFIDDSFRAAQNLAGVPVGTYRIGVVVEDQADHRVTDTVEIRVVEGADDPEGTSTDGTATGGTDGDDDGSSYGDDSGSDGDTGVGSDGSGDGSGGEGDGDSDGGSSGGSASGGSWTGGATEPEGGCACRSTDPLDRRTPTGLLIVLGIAGARHRSRPGLTRSVDRSTRSSSRS